MPPPKSQGKDDDDWETDPDFVNVKSEEEQRLGDAAKAVDSVDMQQIKESVLRSEAEKSKAKYGFTIRTNNPECKF
jgi:hypothetical protein